MNSSLRSALKRLAEMTAELESIISRTNHIISFNDMNASWRREFTQLLKVNKDYWWKMAELENLNMLYYEIGDMNEVQDIVRSMEELEATGRHNYFKENKYE